MPKFLEQKLRQEYGNNPHAIYGTMNKIGAMHGKKETAKGREMERKHEKDQHMKNTLREMRIEVHRDKSGKVTGHTVHHHHMASRKKGSAATMEMPESTAHPFSIGESHKITAHIAKHLGLRNAPEEEAEAHADDEEAENDGMGAPE